MGNNHAKVACVPNNLYCGNTMIDILGWRSAPLYNAERAAKPQHMRESNFMASLFLCTGPNTITWLGDCNSGFCWPNMNTTDKFGKRQQRLPYYYDDAPNPQQQRGGSKPVYTWENTKDRANDTCTYGSCAVGRIYCTKELMEGNGYVFRNFEDYFEIVARKNREPKFSMERLREILDGSRFLCKENNQIEYLDDDVESC